MALICSSLSYCNSSSFSSPSLPPCEELDEKSKIQNLRFKQIDGGYEEKDSFGKILHKSPFNFESLRSCQVGEDTFSISLVGRVALADDLSLLKVLEENLSPENISLPLQSEEEPYSAIHWALATPRGKVSEYLLKSATGPLACNFNKNENSICDACLPEAMRAVKKAQEDKKMTNTARAILQKMQNDLYAQLLSNAWKSKDSEKVRLCLANSSFERDTLGNLLINGAEKGFKSGIEILLDNDPSLVTYATPNKVNSKTWRITALHAAAAEGHSDICSCLLKRGADPEALTMVPTEHPWHKERKQKTGQKYVEYGLTARLGRGLSDLIDYTQQRFYEGKKADWEIFKEIDLNKRIKNYTVLDLFVRQHSIFSSGAGSFPDDQVCQRTEEVIEFLLGLGANPGLPDEAGVSLLEWMKDPKKYEENCIFPYLKKINDEDAFSLEYVRRIIQRMEQAHVKTLHTHASSLKASVKKMNEE